MFTAIILVWLGEASLSHGDKHSKSVPIQCKRQPNNLTLTFPSADSAKRKKKSD